MLAELAAAGALLASPPIVVTRDSLDLPARCSPREVAQTIVRFFDAYNRRDLAALDALFAPAGDDPPFMISDGFRRRPTFRWYTTADARVFDRERLLAHFASRRDELRLHAVDMGRSWVLRSVGFGFRAVRDGRRVHGKGELHCPSGRFYVWSEGADPGEWAPAGPVVAESRTGRRPSAQEVSPDYRLGTTPLRLPRPCRPAVVERRVLTMLRAFNVGAGGAFAGGFVADRPLFQPYTGGKPFRQYVNRPQIGAFVVRRSGAGDGWTALELLPPLGTVGLPEWAVYGLRLEVGRVGPAGSKLVVDCRSGLLERWVGPGVAPPG